MPIPNAIPQNILTCKSDVGRIVHLGWRLHAETLQVYNESFPFGRTNAVPTIISLYPFTSEFSKRAAQQSRLMNKTPCFPTQKRTCFTDNVQ